MARSIDLGRNYSDWTKSLLSSSTNFLGEFVRAVAEDLGYEVRVATRANDFNECINC